MKKLVDFIEETVAGFIGIVVFPGIVVLGILLYTLFGNKLEMS